MKYVDWVDHVIRAAARYADKEDAGGVYGIPVMRLPEEMGFGELTQVPGFTEGPLFEALHDALKDLEDLGLVHDLNQWTFKVTRNGLAAKDLSLATTWHRIFDDVEPSTEELQVLEWLAANAVNEDEAWARTRWVMADEVYAGLGWEWNVARVQRVMDGLYELGCVRGTGFIGGNHKLHPTYVGIVRATERPRFERKEVPAGTPKCFISYAHEDAKLARDIAYGLQAADLGIEIDEELLAGGDSLIDRVAEATALVEFVVAIISSHSVQSNWCKYELALAMTDETLMPGVKVLPVKVGTIEMPPTLRHKVYRSVEELGASGVVEALIRDVDKHRKRAMKASDTTDEPPP